MWNFSSKTIFSNIMLIKIIAKNVRFGGRAVSYELRVARKVGEKVDIPLISLFIYSPDELKSTGEGCKKESRRSAATGTFLHSCKNMY